MSNHSVGRVSPEAGSTRKDDRPVSPEAGSKPTSGLHDLSSVPWLDSRTQGLHSVSEGRVALLFGKPWCFQHGAMNKVREDGIWRCQHAVGGIGDGPVINLCGAGAYLGTLPGVEPLITAP